MGTIDLIGYHIGVDARYGALEEIKELLYNILIYTRVINKGGLEMEYPHLVRVDPKAENKLPDPHNKIFRLENGQLVSVTDIMDWHLFSNPKNVTELPKNEQIVLAVKFTNGFEHRTFSGDWVKLTSLLIRIKIFIRSETLSWEAATYEQRGWGEVAWVLRARADLDGQAFDIITPLKRVAPGEYRMGRPIIMGDHDAFLSLGGKGYKAKRYADNEDA